MKTYSLVNWHQLPAEISFLSSFFMIIFAVFASIFGILSLLDHDEPSGYAENPDDWTFFNLYHTDI
jgi:hypothetical protein